MDAILDIANDELTSNGQEAVEIVKDEDITKALVEAKNTSVTVPTPGEDEDEDYRFARAQYYTLIDKAGTAVDGILAVCEESNHPRSYEVAGQLLKVAGELTKELLALKKLRAEINKFKMPGENGLLPSIADNQNPDGVSIVFQGTSADLLRAIKDAKNQSKDKEVS